MIVLLHLAKSFILRNDIRPVREKSRDFRSEICLAFFVLSIVVTYKRTLDQGVGFFDLDDQVLFERTNKV